MGKNKSHNLTIEERLEEYYLSNKKKERNEVLWHAWCQNKRWISQLLETTMTSFPTFSKHDESHARTVLHNIEMILGRKRIKELSASDCFMILHTVYIHDIGMVITYGDREKIVQNDEFIEMIRSMGDDNDPVFQKAISALQQRDYVYDEDSYEEQMKRLYADKLAVYYAILHLIASFHRTEHSKLSKERLTDWTLEDKKLGAGFSMAGIPQRIFLWIARCAELHTEPDFNRILELAQEDDGYASDYLHPRFVAVLLQLGDILDMDNDRFHPLTRECIGEMPELSERHYEKHQSIRRLYICPDIISIEADCGSQAALRLVRKECDMLREILKEAGYNWTRIRPAGFLGALPTIDSVKLFLNGMQIPEELIATQFKISQNKAFSILEGANVYEGQFVFLREFVQNAIDASKIQYWNECVRTKGYYSSEDKMKKMSPFDLGQILSTDIFPIEVEMEIVKRDSEGVCFSIEQTDIDDLKAKIPQKCQYGVKVRIKDFGTGIDKESIKKIADVGSSRKKEQVLFKNMPEWLKPTAEFGIGLQSAFILTNVFKCYTTTRSDEKYEITFSTVKSNYYEGYINVQPWAMFNSKDDVYGTCFEVFVPATKKLRHEIFPATWDGKDYFENFYEELRSLRHSAELLAQMALYLDGQIGEQLFPIRLNVVKTIGIEIPLNLTDKNRIKHMKCNLDSGEAWYAEVQELIKLNNFRNFNKSIECNFAKRIWSEFGKAWIYYYNSEDIIRSKEIVVEQSEKSVALLDSRDGHFYFWDNDLCTFCVLNMENFLLQEKDVVEYIDANCENSYRKVKIYYKGIVLEERELPDIGNELFEFIDIKGTLSRGYINLSRKGFTEKGEEFFLERIYVPLLVSIKKMLKIMDKRKSDEVVNSIESSLKTKFEMLSLLRNLEEELKEEVDSNKIYQKYYEKARRQYEQNSVTLKSAENRIIIMVKETMISITMLAFFAQKDEFNPAVLERERNMVDSCWSSAVGKISEYCHVKDVLSEEELEIRRDIINSMIESSVLFQIELRPVLNLMKDNPEVGDDNNSKTIAFPDIFSEKRQFMIVSKREDVLASWKQFLVPLWYEDNKINNERNNIIELIKYYSILNDHSADRKKIKERILIAGKNALNIARGYGVNTLGESNDILPGEYRQQYFLKWLLKNIPTIALFMNKDGNMRVNIIHSQILPTLFMNDEAKSLILKRIIEEVKIYNIQRFSLPAWQGLEYLKCENLPYSFYFVKRGYLSSESYRKVVFPFDKNDLKEIIELLNSSETLEMRQNLTELFSALNVRKFIIDELHNSIDRIEEAIKTNVDLLQNDDEKKKEVKAEVKRLLKRILIRDRYGMRLLERVRRDYREAIVEHILYDLTEYHDIKFVLEEERKKYISKWEDVYIYLLTREICRECGVEISNQLMDRLVDPLNSLANAWIYVIDQKYLNDSKILKYSVDYLDALENANSVIYGKHEKIIFYIEKHGNSRLQGEHLMQYWRKYIQELFSLFVKMEGDAYRAIEKQLPDKLEIESQLIEYRRMNDGGTEDANN